MIKVVIFCCKLCGFFKILALFDDFRVQKGVGKILTPLLQPSFSPPPPSPFPPQKGILNHSLCAFTTKQLIDS